MYTLYITNPSTSNTEKDDDDDVYIELVSLTVTATRSIMTQLRTNEIIPL
jgi:hypothetical protein